MGFNPAPAYLPAPILYFPPPCKERERHPPLAFAGPGSRLPGLELPPIALHMRTCLFPAGAVTIAHAAGKRLRRRGFRKPPLAVGGAGWIAPQSSQGRSDRPLLASSSTCFSQSGRLVPAHFARRPAQWGFPRPLWPEHPFVSLVCPIRLGREARAAEAGIESVYGAQARTPGDGLRPQPATDLAPPPAGGVSPGPARSGPGRVGL